MPPKHVAPAIRLKAFSCPHCGALADQTWFDVNAHPIAENGVPYLATLEWIKEAENDEVLRRRPDKNEIISRWKLHATGRALLEKTDQGAYVYHHLINIHVSRCFSCNEISVWRYDTLLYPPSRHEIEPNTDMDDEIRSDFDEARTILDLSPRGSAALLRLCIQKLCKQLGESGENINADIASLVRKGLDAEIQRALDIVRVVGNEAVHPGTMDLKDDRETAAKLFELVNLIAYDRITRPKSVANLFSTLPAEKIAGIAKRDGKGKE